VLARVNDPNRFASAVASDTGGMSLLAGKIIPAQLADIAAYLAMPNI
jgi:hypothetical protein